MTLNQAYAKAKRISRQHNGCLVAVIVRDERYGACMESDPVLNGMLTDGWALWDVFQVAPLTAQQETK